MWNLNPFRSRGGSDPSWDFRKPFWCSWWMGIMFFTSFLSSMSALIWIGKASLQGIEYVGHIMLLLVWLWKVASMVVWWNWVLLYWLQTFLRRLWKGSHPLTLLDEIDFIFVGKISHVKSVLQSFWQFINFGDQIFGPQKS